MMKVPFSPPDIGEEEIAEVVDTLRSGWITTGPKTKAFEKKLAAYCRTDTVACLNSATACAEMALRVLGIGPGDEVIVPAYTYTASASVVDHVGATIVMVDTAPDCFEMDYDQLERAITPRTKAIIPVDIAGVLCDYDRIFDIVERKRSLFTPASPIQEAMGRVAVVADGAHSLGATRKGKISGEIADFTTFSFHAVKNLTTGEGGAVTWRNIPGVDNADLYKQLMLLSLHGQNKDALSKTKLGSWEYDIVAPYFKCNMTDIMASLGLAQLKRYESILARRHEIIQRYNDALAAAPVKVLNHRDAEHVSSGHLYLVRMTGRDVRERNEVIERMAALGVATNVHYKPLPLLTAYRNLGFRMEDYPNAYHLYENEITLPLHTCLSDEQVGYVAECFLKVLRGQ